MSCAPGGVEHIALLVIDMSEEQFAQAGSHPSRTWSGFEKILTIAGKLPPQRVFDCRLWFESGAAHSTLQDLYPGIGLPQSKGAAVVQALRDMKATFVKKVQYSCFFNSELQRLLQQEAITAVCLVGLNTDYCVLATALDAFYLGYKVLIVQEACLTCSGPAGQKKGVTDILRFLGHYARTVSMDQAVEAIERRSLQDIQMPPDDPYV